MPVINGIVVSIIATMLDYHTEMWQFYVFVLLANSWAFVFRFFQNILSE